MDPKIKFNQKYPYDYNSLLYWFPKIKEIKDLNIPKTYYIEFPRNLGTSDEKFKYLNRKDIKEQVYKFCDKLGYPLFVKTDFFSGKHNWKKTCFVSQKEDLYPHIFNIFEMSDCVSIIGLPIFAIVFRKYIPLYSNFKFFHGELPISKERRFFIKDGNIQCKHPYWFSDVFKKYVSLKSNLKEGLSFQLLDSDKKEKLENEIIRGESELRDIEFKLQLLNKESEDEKVILEKMAKSVADVFSGYWSIDFAYSQDGKWYLIDMARGEDSFHLPDCEFASKRID